MASVKLRSGSRRIWLCCINSRTADRHTSRSVVRRSVTQQLVTPKVNATEPFLCCMRRSSSLHEVRAILEPGARACVECGKRIYVDGTNIGDGGAIPSSPLASSKNTLSYHEDRNTRRAERSVTVP